MQGGYGHEKTDACYDFLLSVLLARGSEDGWGLRRGSRGRVGRRALLTTETPEKIKVFPVAWGVTIQPCGKNGTAAGVWRRRLLFIFTDEARKTRCVRP